MKEGYTRRRTQTVQQCTSVALIGPHDRFNFGDLLFEKVVGYLLVHRSNYDPVEIVSAGMVNTSNNNTTGTKMTNSMIL
jgi:hypothetical protein